MNLYFFSQTTPGSAIVEADMVVWADDVDQAASLVATELQSNPTGITMSDLSVMTVPLNRPEVVRVILNRSLKEHR